MKVNYSNTKYLDQQEAVDIFRITYVNNLRKVFVIHLAVRLVIEVWDPQITVNLFRSSLPSVDPCCKYFSWLSIGSYRLANIVISVRYLVFGQHPIHFYVPMLSHPIGKSNWKIVKVKSLNSSMFSRHVKLIIAYIATVRTVMCVLDSNYFTF